MRDGDGENVVTLNTLNFSVKHEWILFKGAINNIFYFCIQKLQHSCIHNLNLVFCDTEKSKQLASNFFL